MPLMINATNLIPCLKMLEFHNDIILSGLDTLLTAEGDAFDDCALRIEASQKDYSDKLVELARLVKILVDEADVPEGVRLSKFE